MGKEALVTHRKAAQKGHHIPATKFLIVVTCLTIVLVLIPQVGTSHLDPPGPPAFQEVIWLMSVTVFDDMDTFFGGELFLDYSITQPGHLPPTTGLIPAAGTVALSAPPPAAFPGAFPIVLYNHINCNPLERPFTIRLTLVDDDSPFGADRSPSFIVIGAPGGAFGGGNAQFGYALIVGVFPAPQFNALCSGGAIAPGAQPAAPNPPTTPTPGPFFGTPDLPVKQIQEGAVGLSPEKPDLFHRDGSGFAAGLILALLVVGVLLWWQKARRPAGG